MWFGDYTQILWLKEHYGWCGRDPSFKYGNFLDECSNNIRELHEDIVTFHSKLLTPTGRSELARLAISVWQVISFLAYWHTNGVKPVSWNWVWLANMPYKTIINFTRLETTHTVHSGIQEFYDFPVSCKSDSSWLTQWERIPQDLYTFAALDLIQLNSNRLVSQKGKFHLAKPSLEFDNLCVGKESSALNSIRKWLL